MFKFDFYFNKLCLTKNINTKICKYYLSLFFFIINVSKINFFPPTV